MASTKKNILPARFDPQIMLAEQRTLVGHVPAKNMARLRKAVVSMNPMVAVEIHFSLGEYGFPKITGWIRHELWLRCERCLGKVKTALKQPLGTCIKSRSEAFPESTDGHEFYEYHGKSIELADFIEDELLLALPLAPKHKDISLCDQSVVGWLTDKAFAEAEDNPFLILKTLAE